MKNIIIHSIHFSYSFKWKENLPDAAFKLITCMMQVMRLDNLYKYFVSLLLKSACPKKSKIQRHTHQNRTKNRDVCEIFYGQYIFSEASRELNLINIRLNEDSQQLDNALWSGCKHNNSFGKMLQGHNCSPLSNWLPLQWKTCAEFKMTSSNYLWKYFIKFFGTSPFLLLYMTCHDFLASILWNLTVPHFRVQYGLVLKAFRVLLCFQLKFLKLCLTLKQISI